MEEEDFKIFWKRKVYRNGKVEKFVKKRKRWEIVPNVNNTGEEGYNRIRINGKERKRQRVIMTCFNKFFDITNPKMEVDHADQNKLNNDFEN